MFGNISGWQFNTLCCESYVAIYGSPNTSELVAGLKGLRIFQGKPPNMEFKCAWCGLFMLWTVSLVSSEDVLKLVNVVSRVDNLIN